MDDREIEELLTLLRAKRESAGLSDSDRELLTRLSADLESLLGQSGRLPPQRHRSLIEQLEESITRFEVSHPDLTSVMAQVSQKLANMGI
jgi:hypothetical protein